MNLLCFLEMPSIDLINLSGRPLCLSSYLRTQQICFFWRKLLSFLILSKGKLKTCRNHPAALFACDQISFHFWYTFCWLLLFPESLLSLPWFKVFRDPFPSVSLWLIWWNCHISVLFLLQLMLLSIELLLLRWTQPRAVLFIPHWEPCWTSIPKRLTRPLLGTPFYSKIPSLIFFPKVAAQLLTSLDLLDTCLFEFRI